MFINYLKTTFRNLARHKTIAFIYFIGLSVSLAACMLIMIWVNYQFSFDKDLPRSGDIYRVYSHISTNGNIFTSSMAPPPLADLMSRTFPEVSAVVRVWKYNSLAVSSGENGRIDKMFNEEVYQADSSFFQVFGYKMLQGDARASMTKPFTVVITRSTAIKYFGEEAFRNGSIPGKCLTLTFGQWGKFPCKITGITEDVPANAHFHYRIIFSNVSDPWNRSQVWVDNTYYTYILLKHGTDPKKIESELPAAIKPYLNPQLQRNFGTTYDKLKENGSYWEYKLQPVTAIHLYSDFERELEPGENIRNVYILGASAIFLLLMACINYANLSTANSIQRSKEIGVRKTLGSSRANLLVMIFTETGVVSLIAWLLAFVLIAVLIRPFENLLRSEFPAGVFVNGWNWIIFISLFFIISILGGLYPAIHLSSVNVIRAIKGKITPGRKVMNFRNGLIVAQFVIFIGLAICTVLVHSQLNYLRDRSPGFNKDNILIVNDPSMLLEKKSDAFVHELKNNPAILSANFCTDYPESGNDNFPIAANGLVGAEDHLFANFSAGYGFLSTFRIELLAGRDFDPLLDNDTVPRVILNEAAVDELKLKDPVNSIINTKYLNALSIENKRYQVIGVTKNFNFQSFHKSIRPIAIFLNRKGTYLSIRIKGGNLASTMADIKDQWQHYVPGSPFDYHFLDERVNNLYKTESVLSNLLNILTVLIIFITVIGLTGLTLLTVQQRVKEIGIRKVAGASVRDILLLFSREYVKWVLLSWVLVSPIAYVIMRQWLQAFAYRVDISIWVFVCSGIAALAVTLITVCCHTVKAAMANPVESLRTE